MASTFFGLPVPGTHNDALGRRDKVLMTCVVVVHTHLFPLQGGGTSDVCQLFLKVPNTGFRSDVFFFIGLGAGPWVVSSHLEQYSYKSQPSSGGGRDKKKL